ncbi:MAG: CapA family protein [Spirochaetales bacterium]|nr:CapA family protein [Spirochaetales bacterium]
MNRKFRGALLLLPILVLFPLCNTDTGDFLSRGGELPLEPAQAEVPEEEAIQAEQTPPEPEEVLISFVGDIMAHDVNYNRPPYSHIYESVHSLFLEDDLTFGNLEFPVDNDKPYSTFPQFNVHSDYVQAAVTAGFDVFSLANNHSADQGKESVGKTYAALEEFDLIYHSGLRPTADALMEPTEINMGEWKIGFLAVTAFSNNWKDVGQVYLVNYKRPEIKSAFLSYIAEKAGEYDLFILSFHDGAEYVTTPREEKILFYRELVDQGVDIVWGHHSHVVQPWEIIDREGETALILPSCGNFISGQTWSLDPKNPGVRAPTGDSAIFQVTLEAEGNSVRLKGINPIYISNYRDPKKGMVVDFTESLMTSDTLSSVWRDYYRSRYAILCGLLPKESAKEGDDKSPEETDNT